MHFSKEALRGIFEALPEGDKIMIEIALDRKNVKDGAGDDLWIIQETMIELGYILPFHKSVTEDGAEEYEDIMQLQELMKR